MNRLGVWSASALCVIGMTYVVALAVGFASAGFDKPIVDPLLAVMETLTLLSAPILVVLMAAVHAYAPNDRHRCGQRPAEGDRRCADGSEGRAVIAPLATQRNSWRRELSKGEAGAFVDGFLNLAMGAVIVGFHNTWSGLPVVLTLVGWCLLIKSMIRFFAPTQALRIMSRVSLERSWEFQVAGGAGFLALASLLGYALYAGWQSMVKQTCGAQRRRLSVPHRPFRHGSAILPDSP